MKMKKILTTYILLIVFAPVVFAQSTEGTIPPPPAPPGVAAEEPGAEQVGFDENADVAIAEDPNATTAEVAPQPAPEPVVEESIVEKLESFGDWTAKLVKNHSAWNTEACVASVSNEEATVEVYAEKVGQEYTEPTVQAIFPKELFEGQDVLQVAITSTDKKRRRYNMFAAPMHRDPTKAAFVLGLEDRAEVVQMIRADARLRLRVFSVAELNKRLVKKGRVSGFKVVELSLSGSSKTVGRPSTDRRGASGAFKACNLSFDQPLLAQE